jgi:putative transposase
VIASGADSACNHQPTAHACPDGSAARRPRPTASFFLSLLGDALKALEEENAKLKKLLAEQMLDAAALRELLSKKW